MLIEKTLRIIIIMAAHNRAVIPCFMGLLSFSKLAYNVARDPSFGVFDSIKRTGPSTDSHRRVTGRERSAAMQEEEDSFIIRTSFSSLLRRRVFVSLYSPTNSNFLGLATKVSDCEIRFEIACLQGRRTNTVSSNAPIAAVLERARLCTT